MTAHAYTRRINCGGNFCGHDPENPDFTLTTAIKTGKGGLPLVLTLCMERIQSFFDDPNILPRLNEANGSKSQLRSERREACIKVLRAILSLTDLASLRVGIPLPKRFMNYTVNYIRIVTGMHQKRVERALHDIKAAGLISV